MTPYQQRKLIKEYPTASDDRREEIFLLIINQYAPLINKYSHREDDQKQAAYERLHKLMLNPLPGIPILKQVMKNIAWAAQEEYQKHTKRHQDRRLYGHILDHIDYLDFHQEESDTSIYDLPVPKVSPELMAWLSGDKVRQIALRVHIDESTMGKRILKEINTLRMAAGKEPYTDLWSSRLKISAREKKTYFRLWFDAHPGKAREYYLKAKASGKTKIYAKNRRKKMLEKRSYFIQ